MIYVLSILSAMCVIAALNLLFPTAGLTALPVFFYVTVLTAAVILVDGIEAALIRLLPEAWFDPEGRLFAVGRRESRFYRAIALKEWKEIVPDLGCFTKFPKKNRTAPNDPVYTGRYLLEAAYGIVIHAANAVTGFLILLIFPSVALRIALPVAAVNAVLSLLPLFVLRSNFPLLLRLHRHNLRRFPIAESGESNTNDVKEYLHP